MPLAGTDSSDEPALEGPASPSLSMAIPGGVSPASRGDDICWQQLQRLGPRATDAVKIIMEVSSLPPR
eukprot:5322630-Pyramimonas_sp.AAC.1